MEIREINEHREELYFSPLAFLSKNTRGRAVYEEKCPIRTEFLRDRDRIIHSKAFRRLKDKTQVFITPTGDHYRTRLTHTLEVTQIARTLARTLALNEDLTEAAALGHDLGHAPFGHRGERVLNQLCENAGVGSFKHYTQSIRVVDILENGGMNLTFEVKDAIINHTGAHKAHTLEGQLIKFADRFAYINHDIDDAIRAGVLTENDLPKACTSVLGERYSERINVLILDLVAYSEGKREIGMSQKVYDAMMNLRTFMFDNVYNSHCAVKKEEEKVAFLLGNMFDFYMKNPDKLNDESKQFLNNFPLARVIADYISGMTDQFAVHTYNQLFIPKGWGE